MRKTKKEKQAADRGQRLLEVTDLLLQRLQQRIEAVDGPTAPSSELRQLTAAVKDIKSMQEADQAAAPQTLTVEGLPEELAV